MVTEDELKILLKSQGWSLGRGKTGKQQAYSAKKYRRGGNISRYIAVTSTLRKMAPEDVLAKLDKPSKKQGESQEE